MRGLSMLRAAELIELVAPADGAAFGFAAHFGIDFLGLAVELLGEVAKLPLGLCVFGAVSNIATFTGAFAECDRV